MNTPPLYSTLARTFPLTRHHPHEIFHQRANQFRLAGVQRRQMAAAKRNLGHANHPAHALKKSKEPAPEDARLILPLCSPGPYRAKDLQGRGYTTFEEEFNLYGPRP